VSWVHVVCSKEVGRHYKVGSARPVAANIDPFTLISRVCPLVGVLVYLVGARFGGTACAFGPFAVSV